MNAGVWSFTNPKQLPSEFKLPVKPAEAVATTKEAGGTLIDFGKETFGYIKLHNLKGKGSCLFIMARAGRSP
ncbi:hypothetical protein LWM68_23800 [Niabella sp. W65]|nr:hypothetical protein [Niabella sp. W65]MCH7365527.1 hypothetical protein [Niabella sp. W65]ULT41310.1 hypothetical protein KRR40_42685 [Niabella sp. I65]